MVATAIFAVSIVAVVGLMGPMTRRVDDAIDSEIAARLSSAIEGELRRLGFATAVSLTGGGAITFVANPDATRVRLVNSDGSGPADAALNDQSTPGIARRDRHFLITLERLTGTLAYVDATSGALNLRADVVWPYWVPVGPASGTDLATEDDYAVVPPEQRQSISYFFAVRP